MEADQVHHAAAAKVHGDVTQTIDTYVYNALMQQGNISLSSAAGFYQSIVGFALVLAANAIVRRYSRESALF